ncbi:DUF1516 family protein [uncultured Limosilactobacillus sp.]|uniref:DUF1516 family protein n=1 Tax=uncultured Limosilactobacillus sp. TaxID=2837629 RepID=UPI0025CD1F3E|nr:DUF1516 family protein [uncultured Limosilactobacillus sp.]
MRFYQFIANVIILLILVFTTYYGTHARKEKRVTDALIITRSLLLLLIAEKIAEFLRYLPAFETLKCVQFIFLLILYLLAETTYRQKRTGFGNPFLNWSLLVLMIFGCLWLAF